MPDDEKYESDKLSALYNWNERRWDRNAIDIHEELSVPIKMEHNNTVQKDEAPNGWDDKSTDKTRTLAIIWTFKVSEP